MSGMNEKNKGSGEKESFKVKIIHKNLNHVKTMFNFQTVDSEPRFHRSQISEGGIRD